MTECDCTGAMSLGMAMGLLMGLFLGVAVGIAIEDAKDLLKLWDRRRGREHRRKERQDK